MTVRLKSSRSPGPPPFSWDDVPGTPSTPSADGVPQSPPTAWLSARDMKTFGAEPLKPEIGIVKCKDCEKPVLKSAIAEHADNCAKIRAATKKGAKGKASADGPDARGKKRKPEDDVPDPDDPSAPKKKKPATKVTKGRFKGPVDYDKQCGVINDKGLPCSRSLTCKSHSMGAKRAVQGRSRPYDELLLEWNRANNPNWVEPVKRESKAERKERKEREKAEKKRQAIEAAAANGIDLTKKGASAAQAGTAPKKVKKSVPATNATAATVALADDEYENFDDIDSEVEIDSLVHSVRVAQTSGVIAIPLAVPCDASSWFVARRERLRSCSHHVVNALMPPTRSSTGPMPASAPRIA